MVDVAAVALVVVGIALLLAGAALSVYGVGMLGALLGGTAGFFLAPIIGLEGAVGVAIAVTVGMVIGLLATVLVLSVAVASLGFVVGGYIGVVLTGTLLGPEAGFLRFVGFPLGGFLGAGIAPFFRRTLLVITTAFVGAILVSGSLTAADLATARAQITVEPLLIDPGSPVLLALFAVGILVQFGLFRFGHVRRIVAILPGARIFRDGADSGDDDGQSN